MTTMKTANWKLKLGLFSASQTISLLGSSLVTYAISWYITLETGSGLMMALSILFGFLPAFFLSPFAGVWADRFNRKWLIMGADIGIALITLGLFAYFATGKHSVWALFIASALRSVGTAIQNPAVGAILPQIVPEDKLMRANGLQATLQSAIALVSPLLSGALMGLMPIQWIFLIDVLTCILAVLVFMWIRIAPHARALEKQSVSYWHDMRQGFVYIRDHTFIRTLFIYFALFFILISPAAFLTPLQVSRSFGPDVWRLTAIEVSFSAGMLLGGFLMTTWGGFKNRSLTMIAAFYLIGIDQVLLGVVPNFWVYNAIMVIVGITLPVFNTPAITLVQEKVDDLYMGRVFGVLTMISAGFMPLGILVFGPLADRISIESQLIATGVLLLVMAFALHHNQTIVREGLAPVSPDDGLT